MRTLKQIGLAVVLTATLGTSAMAGIIETPPAPEPPPPSSSVQVNGIIETPPSADRSDPAVVALGVLQTLLSVF